MFSHIAVGVVARGAEDTEDGGAMEPNGVLERVDVHAVGVIAAAPRVMRVLEEEARISIAWARF